jgi:MYXO-CTERM domain-containing protein
MRTLISALTILILLTTLGVAQSNPQPTTTQPGTAQQTNAANSHDDNAMSTRNQDTYPDRGHNGWIGLLGLGGLAGLAGRRRRGEMEPSRNPSRDMHRAA